MNYNYIKAIKELKWYKLLPVKVGQMIEVQENIGEWTTKRIWKFRGLVIKVQKPNNTEGTFTMRWESSGNKIEKVYPLSYGKFEKVELIDQFKIRQAKIYYMRDKIGKDARLKSTITKDERNKDLKALSF